MSQGTDKKNKHVAIVFGGRSPIALSCAISLARTQQVFLVTRKIDEALLGEIVSFPAITPVEADLARVGSAESVVEGVYKRGLEPTALAFVQRYRPSGEPSFEEHSQVELWSITETLEAIGRLKAPSISVNVVLTSSPAAYKFVSDQDVTYHVVKAGQEAVSRFYSVKLRRSRVSINTVRIGSLVVKPRAQKYWDSIASVLKGLGALSPAGKVPTSSEVGESVAQLISPSMYGLTGQIFTLDGGYSMLDGAQLAKAALEMNDNNHV